MAIYIARQYVAVPIGEFGTIDHKSFSSIYIYIYIKYNNIL